ncbi:MAG: hypothetical protein ACXIUL_12315 [Wenzhouxiangella sp.]
MSIRHDPVTVEPDELVILSRLDLADGAGSDPGNAGGLLVEGRAGALRVVLDDVLVENSAGVIGSAAVAQSGGR